MFRFLSPRLWVGRSGKKKKKTTKKQVEVVVQFTFAY